MRRMHAGWGALVALLMLGPSARAGERRNSEVSIDDQSRQASGARGSARASTDCLQYIGCQVRGNHDGTATVGCVARNANGFQMACESTVPSIVNTALSISDSSHISFIYDGNGNCRSLLVSNNSRWPAP